MIIITSGYPYIDIDAYAGMVAYAELLNLQDIPAAAVSTAPLNESITSSVLSWNAPLETLYTSSRDDQFVLIDLSDPTFFEKFVVTEQISEIIDHHPGFESYWHKELGDKAQIETIGSVATIIFERWQATGLAHTISQLSARLLLTAIIENTLNFGAKVTHRRDKAAYAALLQLADLPEHWAAQYFTELQASIIADIPRTLANDTKTLEFKTFPGPLVVGQMVVWDGKTMLTEYQELIFETFASYNKPWFLNLVSVSEKKSYFICQNAATKAWLSDLLNLTFDGFKATADRLWLRKEIIKADLKK